MPAGGSRGLKSRTPEPRNPCNSSFPWRKLTLRSVPTSGSGSVSRRAGSGASSLQGVAHATPSTSHGTAGRRGPHPDGRPVRTVQVRALGTAPSSGCSVECSQDLVDAARATGSRNVALVPGIACANDLSGRLRHPPQTRPASRPPSDTSTASTPVAARAAGPPPWLRSPPASHSWRARSVRTHLRARVRRPRHEVVRRPRALVPGPAPEHLGLLLRSCPGQRLRRYSHRIRNRVARPPSRPERTLKGTPAP